MSSIDRLLSRSLERVMAISGETEKALTDIKTCPAPCDDCTVSVILPSGGAQKARCPIAGPGCAYGSDCATQLKTYIARVMSDMGVPLRHIDNFSGYRETAAVKKARDWPMRGFLVFCGKPGTGKSFGAAIWRRAAEITGNREAASNAKSGLLLVIDDLGGEEDSTVGRAVIRDIISMRYDAKLPAIITTEMTMDDAGLRYGLSVLQKIHEDIRRGGRIIQC